MTILQAIGLRKTYGSQVAVKALHLDVEEGEIFGLLGPNGAGKTTLISMISGVITPSRGTAVVAGHDVRKQAFEARRAMGLVPQDLALYDELDATQNLSFFGRLYGISGAQLAERIDWALGVAGLSDRARQRVSTFSGGMKRRLNLAAGLIHKPRLLMLDEPTVGVDPQSRNHIFETVRALRSEHKMTVIYTSHYMEEVEQLCERAAIMDHGEIIAVDRVADMIAAHGGGLVELELGPAPAGDGMDSSPSSGPSSGPALERARQAVEQALGHVPGQAAGQARGTVTSHAPLPEQAGKGGIVRFHPAGKLGAAISAVEATGVSIKSVHTMEADLETVFLTHTGKRLRDE